MGQNMTFFSTAGTILSLAAALFTAPIQAARAQPAATDPFVEAMKQLWETQCFPEGCLLFHDIRIGDPDHPGDPDNPEFIQMTLAIERPSRAIKYISFQFPSQIDQKAGVTFLTYKGHLAGDNEKLHAGHIAFPRCSNENCRAQFDRGEALQMGSDERFDLLADLRMGGYIFFAFRRGDGEVHRALSLLTVFPQIYAELISDMESGKR